MCQVDHNSVKVSQHAQNQDSETEPAKWYSAALQFIIFTPVLFMSKCLPVKIAALFINAKREYTLVSCSEGIIMT